MARQPYQPSLFTPKRTCHRGGRIVVTGIMRKDPDVNLFVRALIEIARDQLAQERNSSGNTHTEEDQVR
jgi:hypothetical protein